MFQPTQQRLFRPLSSLSHFKIHQPLPLSPRESRQLLNLLTTSFRQQLDREHGSHEPEDERKFRVAKKATSTQKLRRQPARANPLRPTDQHLHSILTNPLFTYGTVQSTSRQRGAFKSARDPMIVFDEACARGLMTLDHAKSCLMSKKRTITRSSSRSISDGMRESEAGSKVLKWMSSNGLVKADVFREERAFVALLIEYLVAEGHSEIVWMWTNQAFQRYSASTDQTKSKSEAELASQLLLNLVRAQAASSMTLDSAYQTLVKAQTYLERLECKALPLMSTAGCWLSHQTCMATSKHLPATAPLYDLFINTIPSFTNRHEQHLAHLLIHHPTKSSATAALNYFWKTKDKAHKVADKPRWRIIAIGLDAARLLLEQKEYRDAKRVMNFLQAKYPTELGVNDQSSQDFELAKAEADNLELLQNLNLT